jgi:hypothetical protein
MMKQVALMSKLISKSEFARRRGVSPQRVGQWVAEGKITPPALVGEGRSAKINEAAAIEQLAGRLDTNQRQGNGIATKLANVADDDVGNGSLEKRLLTAKVSNAERLGQKHQEEELLRRGVLSETAAVKAAWHRGFGEMIGAFEGAFPGFASAIAAKPGASAREMVLILRTEWRTERERLAAIHRARAGAEPEIVTWRGESPPPA